MASKTQDISTKNLKINNPTDDEKHTVVTPNKNKTANGKKVNNDEGQKGNSHPTTGNQHNEGMNKETKFNQNSIISPQSTKSLNLSTDSNSNHSIKSSQSAATASTSTTNASSPSHPNINRTFIKNPKLSTPSKYNYIHKQLQQQQTNDSSQQQQSPQTQTQTQSQSQQSTSTSSSSPKSKQNNSSNTNSNNTTTTASNNSNTANNTQSRPERPDPINIPSTKSYKKLPFDNDLVLQNLIRAQIEYLFSDYHLTNDTYLLARMQDNPQHWLSIDELCHNQKIRCLTIKKERILQALKDSKYLQLSPECDRVRRPDFTLPKLKPNRDLRRTVFLYGITHNKTEQDIRKLLSQYGHIKRIHFQPYDSLNNDSNKSSKNNIDDEAPNKAVAQLIMKKKFLFPSRYSQSDRDTDNESNHGGYTPKSMDGNQSDTSKSSKRDRMLNDLYSHPIRNPNGDPQDFSHLKTCFVVFESQSQATKCVKARVRAVDGMRCIHKYDYNKVAKKFRTAQMKGEKLSFSPPPPNYQSPRGGLQNQGYRHRGQSPGAQSSGGGYNNYGNNRGRYNRSFPNPNNPGNGGYGNNNNSRGYQSYRDRSHSQSSSHSNDGNNNNNNNRNGGYQSYRTGRYYQRNNNNSRSQTPTFGNSNNSKSQSFYNMMNRGNNNKQNNNNDDKENSHHERRRGLGRRSDRNSHDNNRDSSNDARNYNPNRQQKYTPNFANNQKRPTPSSSPHRSVHSANHSVGNQSINSDTNKPIIYSMNNQQNPQKQPQQTNPSQPGAVPKQQQHSQQSHPKPPQQPYIPNQSRPQLRSANGSMSENKIPSTITSTSLQRSQSASSATSHSSHHHQQQQQQQQQQRQGQRASVPAAPQLYHPIPNALPTRQEVAALQAAGYNHELYYLVDDPMNDPLLYDPLSAYDLYFGVDQSGQPTSTHVAAQQLQQQQQQRASQHSHSQQHSQHSQSHRPGIRASQPQQQYAHTPTHSASQHHVHQSTASTGNSGHGGTGGGAAGYPQQYHPSLQPNSYSAHSYSAQQSNGPRSAPYGPVNTPNSQQSQYQAQQWQLDKLEKFKAQKQALEAQKQAQQQQHVVMDKKPATALSVMSSSN